MSNLPQNFVAGSISQDVAYEFAKYLRNNHVDLNDDFGINRAWGRYSNQLQGGNSAARSVIVGPYNSDNKLYDSGPFTWHSEDVLSDVTYAGSPLLQWVPTGTMTAQKEVVQHITWIAPDDWSGQNYATYLAALERGECEYGPSTKWDACEYEMTYGEFSFSSDTFKIIPSLTLTRPYDRSPVLAVRGPNSGMDLSNDVDFGLVRTVWVAQRHLEWNLIYGDLSNSDMEWDGLNVVIANNFVSTHTVSGSAGSCDFSDPIIVDGSTLGSIESFIQKLRWMVRMIRYRASQRRIDIADGDMAISMPLVAWHAVAENLAAKGMITGSTFNNTQQVEERFNRIIREGFPVDGRTVPVIIEDALGLMVNSNTQVTFDCYVLTRRLGGINILEQKYINYNEALAGWKDKDDTWETTSAFGGIMRTGWITENKKCFYYFLEMGGMMVTRAQPYQGRINDVTVNLESPFLLEGYTFTNDYWANGGTPGSLSSGV